MGHTKKYLKMKKKLNLNKKKKFNHLALMRGWNLLFCYKAMKALLVDSFPIENQNYFHYLAGWVKVPVEWKSASLLSQILPSAKA